MRIRQRVSNPDEILRFRRSERQLHWAIAVPFMVCYVTAIILVTVYNPHPARPFRSVVSWIHRGSGVCLILLPLWTALRHRRDLTVYLHNIRQAWHWNLDDLRWLWLMGPATLNPRISLPEQGKFNAGEKINFMALTVVYPLLICTGVTIWLPGVDYLSWLVHFSLALAVTPLMLGHIFMATVNPDTRPGLQGMLSGRVDRQWARHHYGRWYRANFEGRVAATEPAATVERPRPRPVLVARPSHDVDHPAPASRLRPFEPAIVAGAAGNAPAAAGIDAIFAVADVRAADCMPGQPEPVAGPAVLGDAQALRAQPSGGARS